MSDCISDYIDKTNVLYIGYKFKRVNWTDWINWVIAKLSGTGRLQFVFNTANSLQLGGTNYLNHSWHWRNLAKDKEVGVNHGTSLLMV